MDELYDLHREDGDQPAGASKLYLSKVITDVDEEPVYEPDACPVIRHPNTIPPTEFMALGMYPRCF